MDQDMPLGTEIGLCPGDIVLDGDPAPPMERSAAAPSTFWPMSIVAKRSPISATAELLLLVGWLPDTQPAVTKHFRTLRALTRDNRSLAFIIDWWTPKGLC